MTGGDYVEFGEGVDLDLLADFIGGALAGTPEQDEVAALVAADDDWRAAHAALDEGMRRVGAELASWAPEPMPDEVAARLDALFTPPTSGLPVVEQRERDHVRVGPGAAGGLDVVPKREKRKGPGAGDGNGPGRGSTAAARRRRFVTPTAIAAGVIAFVGFGADYLAGREEHNDKATSTNGRAPGDTTRASAGLAVTKLVSGVDYTAATLALPPGQKPMLAPGEKSSPGLMAQHTAPPELSGLSASGLLLECLRAIEAANGGGTIAAESVDYARYAGSPALIVRFHAANGSWVWAVGPDCGSSGGGADYRAKVPLR